MIPIGIETYWIIVLQYKNIFNNNSALVGKNLYLSTHLHYIL
jgi:hypothetical protein